MIKFGEFLVKNKYITQEELERALLIQKKENKKGFHRMIGYILLQESNMKKQSKDKLYELLKEWENNE